MKHDTQHAKKEIFRKGTAMRKERRLGKWEDKAWKSSMRILLAGLAGLGAEINAAPTGIVVGQDNFLNAYTALLMQSGALAPVAGLPVSSVINVVAMNTLGSSLIGGVDNASSTGYAAIVSPTGIVTPLPLVLPGYIDAVAINPDSNTGLIGGVNTTVPGASTGFAAFVLPDGTISPAAGFPDIIANTQSISSVAINCSNVGLIGGEGVGVFGGPYAAYVATNGTVTPLTITPAYNFEGSINSVAINAQGIGLLGGFANDTGAFAQFVNPSGQILAVFAPAGASGDNLNSVAINNAGLGLIGGQVNGTFYAAYVTQQGDSTTLLYNSTSGTISAVALNSSGAGIIGGYNTLGPPTPYAALVQPNGSLTPLNVGLFEGDITSVAISDAGIGLIGGTDITMSEAYAALVAPNGTVTPLDAIAAVINGVDVSGKAACTLQQATPTTIGQYFSSAYMQFAAGQALESYFIQQCNCHWNHKHTSEVALLEWNDDELTASLNNNYKGTSKSRNRKQPVNTPSEKNSVWVAPFGSYVHLKEHGSIPKYNNQIAGALVACDHTGSNYLVGAGVGYAFNYISYGKGLGHGKVNEEMAVFYGSYLSEHLKLLGALWGGYYQFRNTRHTLSIITSKAKTNGWILAPQFELITPWAIDQKEHYLIEPFFGLEWVNSWQKHFTETGKSGFNLKIRDQYYSLLQSEVGVRFHEKLVYEWGHICIDEKISYVNQAPFHLNSITTSFVGAASSFPIATASNKIENLGALGLMTSFNPKNTAYPYGGIVLEVMANRTYQSYFASFFIGMEF